MVTLLHLSKALRWYFLQWQILVIFSLIHVYEAFSGFAASFSVGLKSDLKGLNSHTLPLGHAGAMM